MFEAKISYLKQLENGAITKKSESYLVHAQSFTEAEANLQKVLSEYISEYQVKALKIVKCNDVILSDSEKVFHVKINYISFDEYSGKEKKITENYYVQCDNLEDCKGLINDRMAGSIVDWSISSIRETKISDIFPYEEIK